MGIRILTPQLLWLVSGTFLGVVSLTSSKATIVPADGSVFLMTDESALLSADPVPDAGTPPADKTCCDSNNNPVDAEPHITAVWSGDVIDPTDPDKVRVNTDSAGTKSVTVQYYVKWLCPGETDPNPDDPGVHLSSDDEIATYEVVVPEVTKLGWNSSHPLYDYWDSKAAINNPVWTKTYAGAVTKNEAGAYTKGATAMAELWIEADQPLTNSTSVEVKGVGAGGDDENFSPESATFHSWTWSSGELVLDSSPLYSSVNYYATLDVKWQFRVEKPDGGFGQWIDMNTTSHHLYTTYGTPSATPTYDYALEKACVYAANTSNTPEVAAALNSGLEAELWYAPTAQVASDELKEYQLAGSVCRGNALLLDYLAESIGVSASVIYMWGGSDNNTICRFSNITSMKLTRGSHEGASTDPSFSYHAQTVIASTNYDPSFGGTGQPSFTTAPAGVEYREYYGYDAATNTISAGPVISPNSPATSPQTKSDTWAPWTNQFIYNALP
jgi:hypothetical protein